MAASRQTHHVNSRPHDLEALAHQFTIGDWPAGRDQHDFDQYDALDVDDCDPLRYSTDCTARLMHWHFCQWLARRMNTTMITDTRRKVVVRRIHEHAKEMPYANGKNDLCVCRFCVPVCLLS